MDVDGLVLFLVCEGKPEEGTMMTREEEAEWWWLEGLDEGEEEMAYWDLVMWVVVLWPVW